MTTEPHIKQVAKTNVLGMTLVELLVTLSLSVVVLMVLTDGLHTGLRVWTRSHDYERNITELVAAGNLLQRFIGQALPETEEGTSVVTFQGLEENLEFSALASSFLGGGTRRLSLRMEPTQSGTQQLVVKWSSLSDAANRLVLLDNIQHLRMRYYGRQEAQTDWHDTWNHRETLPQLVSIDVSFSDPSRKWTRLVIKTNMNFESGCIYSTLNKRCKKFSSR